MNAGEFIKRRERIEVNAERSAEWRKRAMARLISEAGAQPVIHEGQLVAHALPNGQKVCVKRRYVDQPTALMALLAIRQIKDGRSKPQRTYRCPHCGGFHITSKPRYPQ